MDNENSQNDKSTEEDISKNEPFDKVTSVIRDYIKEKEKTDYAILLNGDWGCGKTYFIEKILKKKVEIEKENVPEDKKKRLVYLSAAGITDITEFINDIYLTKASKIINNQHTLGAIKAISKYSSYMGDAIDGHVKLPVIKLIREAFKDIGKSNLNFSNTLIVIDDLERISETIKIEDFLYRIYDSFISQNIKVLFVANESEIDKENKESEYKKIKEKIIRHTIALHDLKETGTEEKKYKSFESIIDDIALSKLEDEQYIKDCFINEEFFKKHIEDIKHLFNERKHFNIRTFLTHLDLSKKIGCMYKELNSRNDIVNEILNNLCLFLIESNSDKRKLFKDYSSPEVKERVDISYIADVMGDKIKPKNGDNSSNIEEEEATKKLIEYGREIYRISRTISTIPQFSSHLMHNSIDLTIINILREYVETGYLKQDKVIEHYNDILFEDADYLNAWNTLGSYTNEGQCLYDAIKIIMSRINDNIDSFSIEVFIFAYDKLNEFDYLISNEIDKYKEDIKQSIKEKISELDEQGIDKYINKYSNKEQNSDLSNFVKEELKQANQKFNKDKEEELLNIFNNQNDTADLSSYSDDKLGLFKIIFQKEFLKKINITAFSITILIDNVGSAETYILVNSVDFIEVLLNNIKDYLKYDIEEFLQKHANNMDYNFIHLKKRIDTLKEEIKKGKEKITYIKKLVQNDIE